MYTPFVPLSISQLQADLFKTSVEIVRSETEGKLQGGDDWLDLMRGISLKPPQAIAAQFKSPADVPPSLKDIEQLNAVAKLSKTEASELETLWREHGHLSKQFAQFSADAALVTGKIGVAPK